MGDWTRLATDAFQAPENFPAEKTNRMRFSGCGCLPISPLFTPTTKNFSAAVVALLIESKPGNFVPSTTQYC
ncbi:MULTISPECIES: hypothetical protein [unclassified Synechococcus]|uniref:hypothetical protein n=1 Tax=unclassified Synechococcus TaxID=2626047 RepID=UPI0039B0AA97